MPAPTAVRRSATFLDAALEYAQRGWRVLPVVPRGKRPATKHGYKDATTDERCLRSWWARDSSYNVAIATGADSGVVVLDVDGDEGKEQLRRLELEHGPLPRTPHARTGGAGEHYMFDARSRSLSSSVRKLGPGLDVRGEGGLVVVPPSQHASGRLYSWYEGEGPDDIPLAPLPDWLIRLATLDTDDQRRVAAVVARAPRAYLDAALRNERSRVARAQPGERNDTLNRAAFAIGQLVEPGSSDEGNARGLLMQAAEACGLPLSEAERTIAGALVAGQGSPRARSHVGPDAGVSSSEAARRIEWSAPQPLESRLPPFPTHALPLRLRAWVIAESEATQTPPELSALMGLATVSAACAGWLRVQARPGWIESTNIFACVVLPPGNRKSAVVSDATAPLLDFERQVAEELAPAIAEANAALRLAEQRLKTLEAGSGKMQSSSTELNEAAREVLERRKAVPATPKLVCSDVTPEELVRQLEAQGGSIALIDAEGCGLLGIILGRYSRDKLPQVDVFLRAHSGDHIRVDRVGRESSSVRNPALTIGIAAQPALLDQLNANPQLRGLGLPARFMWAVPASTVGSRRVRPPPVPGDVRRDYERAIRTLLTLKRAKAGEAHVLKLSADADDVLAAFEEQLEPRLGRGGDLEQIVDWAGKLSGAIVRIAGLLHALDFLEEVEKHPISAETLCNAIEIGECLLAHAKVALSETTSESTSRYASSIVAWLQRRGLREFSKRDCHTELRSRFERAVDIDEPLRLLQARGWIAAIEMPSRDGAGRPPSPRFVVNPSAHHAQNAQKGSS